MNLPPFMNPNYEYAPDEEWVDDIRGRSIKEITALFMEDMLNKEQGKVAPDTTGADYFFLKEFITNDMELDFALIEQEFLYSVYLDIHLLMLEGTYKKRDIVLHR